jgi:hypothetical protein
MINCFDFPLMKYGKYWYGTVKKFTFSQKFLILELFVHSKFQNPNGFE